MALDKGAVQNTDGKGRLDKGAVQRVPSAGSKPPSALLLLGVGT